MSEQAPIDHAVVFINEHAANAARVRKQMAKVALPQTEVIMSLNQDENLHNLDAALRDGSAIMVGSGDGGFNNYLNAMYSGAGREVGLADYPTAALRGGGACDNAVDAAGFASARRLLARGKQEQVWPMMASVDGGEPRYAQSYISIGGTAAASLALEGLKVTATPLRKKTGLQFMSEALVSWFATADYPAFTYQPCNDEPQTATDVLFANTGTMAKIGRPHGVATDPRFELLTMNSHGNRVTTLGEMFKMAGGALDGVLTDHAAATFATDEAVLLAQFDGEVVELPSTSHVEVNTAATSYTALRLR